MRFNISKAPGQCVPIGQRCSPFTSPYHGCCDGICEVEPPACLKENPPCVFDLDLGGAGTCWKGNIERLAKQLLIYANTTVRIGLLLQL